MKGKKQMYIIYLLISSALIVLLVTEPKTAVIYAEKGLLLCGSVIIPSLFPINFCVIFIMRILSNFDLKSVRTKSVLLFLFSLIGGYPTGAKLINEEYKHGFISQKSARIMQYYSANGGMGFIISAVGYGIYGSKEIGYLLFLAHSLSSALLFVLLKRFSADGENRPEKEKNESIADMFVLSASEASNAILSICSFVIFFSVINGFLIRNDVLKYLCFVTEITSALTLSKNIYLTAFLLGFGGISIWCQIIAVSKDAGVNLLRFILARVFCGGFSAGLMYLFLKIFKVNTEVFSNNVSFVGEAAIKGLSLSISLLAMALLFIISLEGKKRGGNFRYDLLK